MSNAFTERRIGRFSIDRNALYFFQQDRLQAIFRDMVVLDCRVLLVTDTIEYVAVHPGFEPVDQGAMIHEYKAIGHEAMGPDDDPFVTWEKVK